MGATGKNKLPPRVNLFSSSNICESTFWGSIFLGEKMVEGEKCGDLHFCEGGDEIHGLIVLFSGFWL